VSQNARIFKYTGSKLTSSGKGKILVLEVLTIANFWRPTARAGSLIVILTNWPE